MAISAQLVGNLGGTQVARFQFASQTIASSSDSWVVIGTTLVDTIGVTKGTNTLSLPTGQFLIAWDIFLNDTRSINTQDLQSWMQTASSTARYGLVGMDPAFSSTTYPDKNRRVAGSVWSFSGNTTIRFGVWNGLTYSRPLSGYGATIVKLS